MNIKDKDPEYFINGKNVNESEYEEFIELLTPLDETYHCAKTIGGGRTSYEAKDVNGVYWICRTIMKNNISQNFIDRKD